MAKAMTGGLYTGDTVTYQYDNDGALARTVDSGAGKETAWLYDMTGRLVKYTEKNSYNSYSSYSISYEYNAHNNVAKTVEKRGSQQVTSAYDYDEDQRVTAAHITSEVNVGEPGYQATAYHILYTYDALGRMQEQRIVSDSAYTPGGENNGVVEYAYSYAGTTTSTSSQISQMELSGTYLDETFSYTYTAEGYISSATEGLSSQAGTDTYSYNLLGELEYEYDTTAGKMWHRFYDGAGNTVTRSEYALTETGGQGNLIKTDTFTYGDDQWGDLLTAYNGTPITYDQIGNRLTDGTWTYTWEHGRELSSMTKSDSSSSWEFSYDANGLRTQRTDNNHYNYYYGAYEHYEYQYDSSGRLIYMDHMGDTMYFSYDPVTGFPQTMIRYGMVFYYVTNSRGDVMAILDDSGNYCAVYEYDAWGNVLYASDCNDWIIAEYNPLLYRGYIYDWETGLYYLQSRYYDPEIGRFINADSQMSGVGGDLTGNNMFAYCFNNPVNLGDPSGHWPQFVANCIVAIATIVSRTVVNHIINAVNKKKIDHEIKDSYTKEEATEAINGVLKKYSDDSKVTFDIPKSDGSYVVEITESYHVNSRYDRQKICAIIENTGVTAREYDNMSAEWVAHNIATPIPFLYEKAHSVGIDYISDHRIYVTIPSMVLEILGWE